MGCSQVLLDAKKIAGVIVPLKHSGVSLRHMCEVINNSAIETDQGGRFHKLFCADVAYSGVQDCIRFAVVFGSLFRSLWQR